MLEQQLAAAPPKDTGVIMVSLLGADDEQWQSHAATMPADWIVAYTADEDFGDSDLYDIPITPTVYLIAPDTTILAKNIKDINAVLSK